MSNEILIALLICISCVFCIYFICTLRAQIVSNVLSHEMMDDCWNSVINSYIDLKAKMQLFEDKKWTSLNTSLPDKNRLVKVLLTDLTETVAIYKGDKVWAIKCNDVNCAVLAWHYIEGKGNADTK